MAKRLQCLRTRQTALSFAGGAAAAAHGVHGVRVSRRAERLARTGLVSSDIVFTTAASVHARALAEFVVLGLLYFTKDVRFLRRPQAARRWERYTMRGLGQTALVVGLGEVGREIALSLSAFGIEVWGMRRAHSPTPEGIARKLTHDELLTALPHVDALVLACPLTDETRGLIGAPELAALKSSAVLVNVARGPVIVEAALIEALQNRRIAGAALDVFVDEPLPSDSPFWEMDNVLVSPHSASTIADENQRIVDIFIDNLHRYLDNQPLRNVFDRERGYRSPPLYPGDVRSRPRAQERPRLRTDSNQDPPLRTRASVCDGPLGTRSGMNPL